VPRPTSRLLAGRRPALRVAAPLLAGVLLLTGCSSLEGTGDKGYVTADGSVGFIEAGDREEPVELTGDDLEGKPLDLADFRGRTTVVNVWWSGCAPCRKEQPELVEAASETKEFADFVGINIRDGATSQSKAYVRNFGVEYPSFYSPDGKALLPFSDTVPPNAIPSTIVLDDEGRVAGSIIGPVPSKLTLVQLVERVAGVDPDSDGGSSSDG